MSESQFGACLGPGHGEQEKEGRQPGSRWPAVPTSCYSPPEEPSHPVPAHVWLAPVMVTRFQGQVMKDGAASFECSLSLRPRAQVP